MRQSLDSDHGGNVKDEIPQARTFGISTSHLTASMTVNDVTNRSIAIDLDPSRISSTSIIDDSTISANLLARNTMVISDLKPLRKRATRGSEAIGPVHYQGTTLNMAAMQGNLPLFVMLWGMSKAKKVNLLAPDAEGNNPLHYAALAETTEVMTFIFGQTKGFYTPEVRLVDTRNNQGETPLLKATTIGKISVVKTLLEEGSDPFVTSDSGDTAFITLAKFGHLWAFHYLFVHIRDKYNEHTVLDHLHMCDSDGHNCLDWAADSGTINLIEYLIRRGMNIQRLDSSGRGPLYWAVKSHRAAAVRFLLRCGCDPYATDSGGSSPHLVARERRDSDLLHIMAKESKRSKYKHKSTSRTVRKSSDYEAPPTTAEDVNAADSVLSDIEQPNSQSPDAASTSKDVQMIQVNQAPVANPTSQYPHFSSSQFLRQSRSSNGHLRQSHSSQGDIDLVATSLPPPGLASSPPSAPTGNTPPPVRAKHHTPRGSFSTMSSTGVSPARLTFQLLKFTQTATMSFHNEPLASDPEGLDVVSYIPTRSLLSILCCSWTTRSKDKSGTIRYSHAIYRANATRPSLCLYYLILYSIFWVLTMCLPFYFWLVLLGISIFLYK